MGNAPVITIPAVMSMMRLIQLSNEVWESEDHSPQRQKAEMKLESLEREFNPSELTEGLWALHENTVTYVRAEHLEGYLAFTMNGDEVKTVESSELVYAWKTKGKIKLLTVPPRMGIDRYYKLKRSLETIQGKANVVVTYDRATFETICATTELTSTPGAIWCEKEDEDAGHAMWCSKPRTLRVAFTGKNVNEKKAIAFFKKVLVK